MSTIAPLQSDDSRKSILFFMRLSVALLLVSIAFETFYSAWAIQRELDGVYTATWPLIFVPLLSLAGACSGILSLRIAIDNTGVSGWFAVGFSGILIFLWMFSILTAWPRATTISNYRAAMENIERSSLALGEEPNVMQQVRELENIKNAASSDLLESIAYASTDSDDVQRIISVGTILGPNHPNIRFVSENAMVRSADEEAIKNDLIEMAKKDKDVPGIARALASMMEIE